MDQKDIHMIDPEFDAWSSGVESACERAGLPLPDPETLSFMYDDGLEPEDTACPEIRARYCGRPERSFGRGAGDLAADQLHRPD